MKQVLVSWDPGAARFVAEGSHRGYPIAINAPHDGAPTGFSASELLLAGIGACSAWDVVEILRKKRLAVSAVDVEVLGEQDADAPWPFRRIEARYRVRGRSLPLPAVQRAVELSEQRYCSVIATVRGVASVHCIVEVVEDDAEAIPHPPVGNAPDDDPGPDDDPAADRIRVRSSVRTEG